MRWIDIVLPEPGISHDLDALMSEAADVVGRVGEIQERDGLDAVTVVHQFAAAGRLLFQAVTLHDPEAFSPAQDAAGLTTPDFDLDEHDDLIGYHLVVDPGWVGLPWNWLHNGLRFLLERHPICAACRGSGLPEGADSRPWMQRLVRSRFLVADDGGRSLRALMPQLRPNGTLPPEMLFIPGHTDRKLRKLIYREAEIIGAALDAGVMGGQLVRLDIPDTAVTPSRLCVHGLGYQVLHFAGPTSMPARIDDTAGEYWMNRLIDETAAPADDALDSALGLEGEVLGVDPITSLLDDVSTRYEQRQEQAAPLVGRSLQGRGGGGGSDGTPASGWLLDDGPVEPERLGRRGQLPPLVFSNSHSALPKLGPRFLAAGASTFIGPSAPLFSRPARRFAAQLYRGMGEGWCAGAALWRAAAATREDLGVHHPAWLSYGLQGFGSLALQYL